MAYLIHFNPNHDPKNGQFTFSPGDRVIKKGTETYRVAWKTPNDPTYDNKKYVSLTKEDNEKWLKKIGDADLASGEKVYNIMYMTTDDLRIAPYEILGKMFMEQVNNGQSDGSIAIDTEKALNFLKYNPEDYHDAFSTNFAAQTETGKKWIKELMEQGYDGIEDRHGRNVADDPIIIFDPDKNLKKKKATEYKG